MLRLPPERLTDPEWTNLREHDIQEHWDLALAPWVATAHAARMEHAIEVIEDHSCSPARVIDVGCAKGTLGYLLAGRGFDVTLVDVCASHVAYARARSDEHASLQFCVGLVPTVPEQDGFDVVVCTEVIEHMPTPRMLLDGLRQKCRPGGMLYLTTPNGAYFFSKLPTYSKVAEEVLANMVVNSDDGDDHRYGYTLEELVSVVRAAGFAVREAGIFLPFWMVGWAHTEALHRLHLMLTRRLVRHRPGRRRQSRWSRATGTSLYVVGQRLP
jgi:2-polyprenyl-3-methyl-5-hydroxy-6-metoxy-1,4-benzoquinol methylase